MLIVGIAFLALSDRLEGVVDLLVLEGLEVSGYGAETGAVGGEEA